LSVDPKRRKTINLYTKEREGKLNADCQSRSPMPTTSAESSSSPWGQARPTGAGEAGGGRRDWWGQARPMGAVSHRPHARARQHRTLGKPPGQIPSQHQMLMQVIEMFKKIASDVHPGTSTVMCYIVPIFMNQGNWQ
jgi:hypothetical protein